MHLERTKASQNQSINKLGAMKLMLHLFLVVCFHFIVVRSEVVSDFSQCSQFFYKATPPQLTRASVHTTRICQKFEGQYYYATLYSKELRIPLFSAYTLPAPCNVQQPNRRSTWFIEPQLSDVSSSGDMRLAGRQQGTSASQAINLDYRNTGYDRGHLNPNFYQCDVSRTATFTLTNAVPQDPCFNQQSWRKMEDISEETMRQDCAFPGAGRYFVTGVVQQRTRIPNEEHDVEEEGRDYNRVTIPSHMWTAACCYDTNYQGRGFSFAYIGKNKADSIVEVMTVTELEEKLVGNYLLPDGRYERARIFTDDCHESSEKSKRIRVKVSAPMDIRVANTLDSLSRVDQSSLPSKKRKLVHESANLISANKRVANNYSIARLEIGIALSRDNNLLKNTRELLLNHDANMVLIEPYDFTAVSKINHKEYDAARNSVLSAKRHRKSLKKHLNASDDSKYEDANNRAKPPLVDNYLIVPSLDAEGSDVSLEGDRCVNSSCKVGGAYGFYKGCYTDWDKTEKACCTSECKFHGGKNYQTCYTGPPGSNTKEKECSTRSSAIAVSGKRCLADHECGLHGEGYYWCYVDIELNWDYCCQPWHACGEYGYGNKWCYTGQTRESKYQYCDY